MFRQKIFFALFICFAVTAIVQLSCTKSGTGMQAPSNSNNKGHAAGLQNKISATPVSANTVTACGNFYGSSFFTINQYHQYPFDTLDLSSVPVGTTINVTCHWYNIPNRFTIYGPSGTIVASSPWEGNVTYPGPWGPSIHSCCDPIHLSFTKTSSSITYYLLVETVTAPNGTYNPATDTWDISVSCP